MNTDHLFHIYDLADCAEARVRSAQSCVSHVTAEEYLIHYLQDLRAPKRVTLARRASTLLLPTEDER